MLWEIKIAGNRFAAAPRNGGQLIVDPAIPLKCHWKFPGFGGFIRFVRLRYDGDTNNGLYK